MTEHSIQALAPVLGRVPSGLFILTATDGTRETGMLSSWVMQCSFDPPRVSVALRGDRDLCAWLATGAPFTLNLIAEGQGSFLTHFGKGYDLDQPAFTGLHVERLPGEAPILLDTLGHLLCRVVSRHNVGDHDLFIGTVVGGRMTQPDGKPWTHVRKSGLRY